LVRRTTLSRTTLAVARAATTSSLDNDSLVLLRRQLHRDARVEIDVSRIAVCIVFDASSWTAS
jgi:hypothetical protein